MKDAGPWRTRTASPNVWATAGDRLLIVNCDDLGVSRAANVATSRAMVEGVATSATLMVPCPYGREAAGMFAGMELAFT